LRRNLKPFKIHRSKKSNSNIKQPSKKNFIKKKLIKVLLKEKKSSRRYIIIKKLKRLQNSLLKLTPNDASTLFYPFNRKKRIEFLISFFRGKKVLRKKLLTACPKITNFLLNRFKVLKKYQKMRVYRRKKPPTKVVR